MRKISRKEKEGKERGSSDLDFLDKAFNTMSIKKKGAANKNEGDLLAGSMCFTYAYRK
jgi:hypothetical protein